MEQIEVMIIRAGIFDWLNVRFPKIACMHHTIGESSYSISSHTLLKACSFFKVTVVRVSCSIVASYFDRSIPYRQSRAIANNRWLWECFLLLLKPLHRTIKIPFALYSHGEIVTVCSTYLVRFKSVLAIFRSVNTERISSITNNLGLLLSKFLGSFGRASSIRDWVLNCPHSHECFLESVFNNEKW